MKKIIVTWQKTTVVNQCEKELIVIYSNHKKFAKNTRFDFGFMNVASREGYIIEILP